MASAPRSDVFIEGEVGVYHCYNRTVRQAMLCGVDPLTHTNYDHRRTWIADFERRLAALFAVEVCFHAEMANHLHVVLRVRPDLVLNWSDEDVVQRWLTITHLKRSRDGKTVNVKPSRVQQELNDPARVAAARRKLAHISFFMGALCEYVARRSNQEEGRKGCFWEGRFECTSLMDDGAILACGIYVDLNQIRACEALTPEESRHTSAYDRLLAWQQQESAGTTDFEVGGRLTEEVGADSPADWLCRLTLRPDAELSEIRAGASSTGRRVSDWGLLPIQERDYFQLLDVTGRIVRANKPGAIPSELPPLLERLKSRGIPLNTDVWGETICSFPKHFGLVIGEASLLAQRAAAQGRKWFRGTASCARLFQ